MVHEIVRGEISNSELLFESHNATYQTSFGIFNQTSKNLGFISKERKERQNKQGLVLCKGNRFVDRQKFLTDTFQEKEKENCLDKKTIANQRIVQRLVKEKRLSHDMKQHNQGGSTKEMQHITDLRGLPDMKSYDKHEQSWKSKEITHEDNDVIEKTDEVKDKVKMGPGCSKPIYTDNQLDDENAKFARIKMHLPDGKKDIKVKEKLGDKEITVKNENREIVDNKLLEEMEQRYNKGYCHEETSPKIELCVEQKICQGKLDLPEKRQNEKLEPKLRSLEEGEWLSSVQENSCDSFHTNVLDSSHCSVSYENDSEMKQVKNSTEWIEEMSEMNMKNTFEKQELVCEIVSALKLLHSELRSQSLISNCKAIIFDEFQPIQKNFNVESHLAMMFMKLLFNFEPSQQPEKCESENGVSEKEEKYNVEMGKSDPNSCVVTEKDETEPALPEKQAVNNKETVITEDECSNTTEKGDTEESEKWLRKGVGDVVENYWVKTETAGEKDMERKMDGCGEEKVEDLDKDWVTTSARDEDKVCINEDANGEVESTGTVLNMEGRELISKLDGPVDQNDTAGGMKPRPEDERCELTKRCVIVISPVNKIAEPVIKTKETVRKCKKQGGCTKHWNVEVMKFEQEMMHHLEDLLQESREWLKKSTRYCLQTCRTGGQNNHRKPNRYEPRSKSNGCDIFVPKTMKERKRLRMLQCGQMGRRCSDSGSNSGGPLNTREDKDQTNRGEKDNEDHNNNHSGENRQNNRGNPNEGSNQRNNNSPGTSLQDATVPQWNFKAYRKKHSDISVEHWEKFLGFIKDKAESRAIPLWDLHPNPVAPCLALCMKLTDELPDDMLECIVCLSINSLLKHYANCSSTYMNCDLCMQIFSLICCHVNECVQRAEAFGDEDGLHTNLHVKLCRIQLCRRIRQALNNNDISHHLKMLWFHVRKKLSRVIGGTEIEIEETTTNRRPSIFGTPSSLESIPENSVSTVTPASRPVSKTLSRKPSNLSNVAEAAETTSISSGSGSAHAELVSSDAVPEPHQQIHKETNKYSSLPIGPPKATDLQFPSFTDRPTGQKGIGEVVYGSKSQLKMAAKSWDTRKKDYQEEGKLPTHYREEGVILDRYMNKLTIQGVRYQKDFQWVRVSALGNGMSGKCSLATDFETDAKFCVKEIHIASYEMEEIILWTDLDHPYIVQLYGAIRFGERVFIFMEYIAGGCLTEAINHQKELGQRLSQATALRYFQQILEVLVHLKAKHILHEDLKGDNILLHKEGTNVSIKVTDFGAARRCEDKVRKGTKPIGTQTQWSPEKAEATGYSYPAELWAAVCVLVHMLSGMPPWIRRFGSFKTLIVVIVDHSPPIEDVPRNIAESVRDLIQRGFTVCPGTRPTAEKLLRHSAFSILVDSPPSEAYSILAPGFQSVPCIEDDLTKDLREIYKHLGATSPDKKKFPFLQPSTTVQVYTVGGSTEQETNNMHSLGGARSLMEVATGQRGRAHRRNGRLESEEVINQTQQTVDRNVHQGEAAQNGEGMNLELKEMEKRAENRPGMGRSNGRMITPVDPNKNLDPLQHFNNFLNDTTPLGFRPPETTDNVIEYNPDTAEPGGDEEINKSNDSSLRISSDDMMKKFVPKFDLLLDPEEKSDNYGDDIDSEDDEEEDMFKDFDLNTALKKMNLSSDKFGDEIQVTEKNEGYNDDEDKKQSEAAAKSEPFKPIVHKSVKPVVHLPIKPINHCEQEAYNSIDGDDLFKSGSPTSAGYSDSQINLQHPASVLPGNPVQGPEHIQHAWPYDQHGQGQLYASSSQYQLQQPHDQQYRNPNPQAQHQYWKGPISVQVQNTNYGISDQISPRHSTANPYNHPGLHKRRVDPLSLSPIQNTRYPPPTVEQRYPHSLSPSHLQDAQGRHFDNGHGSKPYQTIHERRQMGTQQWVDHHRVQQYMMPNSAINYPSYYKMSDQMRTSNVPQQPSIAPSQFSQQTDHGMWYLGQQQNTRSQYGPVKRISYVPMERIITEPPGQSAIRHSNLQLDVEKAKYGGSLPPSTYAQTAPVESPPKTSPTYKRARSYMPTIHQPASPTHTSVSSTNKTSKSQLEEQARALLELQHTARKELSQHEGSIHDFQDEEEFGVEGEIDVTGNLTSQEWDSMAVYLQDEEKDSRIEVTFKKRGEEETDVMKMKFARKTRTATWESIIDDDLSRLSSEYERFCLRHEDGTLLDINSHLGEEDVVLFIELAEDGDWWCVEKGMIMKS